MKKEASPRIINSSKKLIQIIKKKNDSILDFLTAIIRKIWVVMIVLWTYLLQFQIT